MSPPEDRGDNFSETSVHIRTTRRYIPEDGNIHCYRCENLKSYKRVNSSALFGPASREGNVIDECGILEGWRQSGILSNRRMIYLTGPVSATRLRFEPQNEAILFLRNICELATRLQGGIASYSALLTVFLSLWGATCCVIYVYYMNIYYIRYIYM
jgi:hypothetical protein